MKYQVLFTAPYMIPFAGRFKPVFDKYNLELIIPDVQERMEEADLLKYAGQFDGAICGDDRYTLRVIEACIFNKNWTYSQRLHHARCRFCVGIYARLRPPPTVDG
jgi:hypothetical protein